MKISDRAVEEIVDILSRKLGPEEFNYLEEIVRNHSHRFLMKILERRSNSGVAIRSVLLMTLEPNLKNYVEAQAKDTTNEQLEKWSRMTPLDQQTLAQKLSQEAMQKHIDRFNETETAQVMKSIVKSED